MKIWDNVILRNLLNSTVSVKYFAVAWPDSGTQVCVSLCNVKYTRTILRNKNMGQSLFKKHSKFQNFDEIFYCGMTRPRNTNLDAFTQCQQTRTILKSKNMEQSLFNKYSNLQKFDEVLYCWMTRFRKVKLGVFRQYQNPKTILKKKNMGQNSFENFQNSKNFN